MDATHFRIKIGKCFQFRYASHSCNINIVFCCCRSSFQGEPVLQLLSQSHGLDLLKTRSGDDSSVAGLSDDSCETVRASEKARRFRVIQTLDSSLKNIATECVRGVETVEIESWASDMEIESTELRETFCPQTEYEVLGMKHLENLDDLRKALNTVNDFPFLLVFNQT